MNDRTVLLALMASIIYAGKQNGDSYYPSIYKAQEILGLIESAESAGKGGAAMGAAVTAPSCIKGEMK